jgi:hypothetical protein
VARRLLYREITGGYVMKGLVTAVIFSSMLRPCSGQPAARGGGDAANLGAPRSCLAPEAMLAISVTAQECAACNRLFIVAQSAQITAAIGAGQSPCSQPPPVNVNLPGCMVSDLWIDSFMQCGGGPCGPYAPWNLADDFEPAIAGAVPPITDMVSFCPFDCTDAACAAGATPAGACVSSSTNDLCDPSATITMIINGIVPPGGGGR